MIENILLRLRGWHCPTWQTNPRRLSDASPRIFLWLLLLGLQKYNDQVEGRSEDTDAAIDELEAFRCDVV